MPDQDGQIEADPRSFRQAVSAVVSDSPAAVFAFDTDSAVVFAHSPVVHDVFSGRSHDLIGSRFTELLQGQSLVDVAELAGWPLNGGQLTSRAAGPGSDLTLWLRMLTHPSAPTIALAALPDQPALAAAPGSSADRYPVIGATDSALIVDRIGDEIEPLFGLQSGEVLGQSLLALTPPSELPALLSALSLLARSRRGVSLRLQITLNGFSKSCQLMLLPLPHLPGCAFSLQPADDLTVVRAAEPDVERLIRRLLQGIDAVRAARELSGLPSQAPPMLAQLTGRELQIVQRLQAGDRVPAIAQRLFVAQSTVRNHLSAVFAKLGVNSQQELIVLLRATENISREA